MHWTGDGRIEVNRNFALGVAAVIVGLALAAMFLIGMVVGGDGDDDGDATIDPTPTVLAAETETEAPTVNEQATAREETATPTMPQTGTKTEYSSCLYRTHRSLLLDVESARFTPWPDYGDNRSVWDVIRYRHVDYISDYCQEEAPAPPANYSSTCIPRELQAFYRRHIPEGNDTASHQAIAAQYALTVCQPAADR